MTRRAAVALAWGLPLLLAAAGCDSPFEQLLGEVQVTVASTGGDLDLDGYEVVVGAEFRQAAPVNGSVLVSRVPAGVREVELSGVAGNCTVTGDNPRAVSVPGGETARVAFAVTCVATGVEVAIATTGVDLDSDGYAVSVDGAPPVPVLVTGSLRITRLTPGSHTVALSGAVVNCSVGGENPRTVPIAAGEVVPVAFTVTCVATTGAIEVTAVTTGVDFDPNGYTLQVGQGSPQALAANARVTVVGLSAGDYALTVGDMAGNCSVAGANPRTLSVTTGGVKRDTARTTFELTCLSLTGVVEVTAVSSGIDLDLNYTIQLDNGPSQPLAPNARTTISGVTAGDHGVRIGDVATNCTLAGENPRTVSVTAGGTKRDTARTTFEVTCVAATGAVGVTTTTTGVNPDPNGYTVRVDGGPSESVGTSAQIVISGLSAGDHTVTLGDVAINCNAGQNPRTVSVTTGGTTRDTARTSFELTCSATTGAIEVSAATSGVDLDPNGYTLIVDGDESRPVSVAANGFVRIDPASIGSHALALTGVAGNCAVSGDNPRSVTVAAGAPTQVTFTVTCAALGAVQVTVATTGVDLDPNGYSVAIERTGFGTTGSVPTNGSATLSGLIAGDYTVTLREVTMNCDVASTNPRMVAVPSGGVGAVAFDVACAQARQLAVVLAVSGNTDIYLVKSNGVGLTRLTTDPAHDGEPAWSPDGTKIAFRSNRDGNPEIYVMNVDGSNPVRLTNHLLADYQPGWSPDGTRIAFYSERDANADIYVMNAADGTTLTRLTSHSNRDTDPVWSPDGRKIAFSSTRDGNAEIYVMNPDGSGVTRLTNNSVDDVQPAWSPDGAKLVFSRLTGCDYYYGCDYDLVVMNADGSGAATLTTGSSDTDPAWSPDGRWIAFGFCDYYYGDCYESAVHVVRSDGSRRADVLSNASQPAWRP